MPMACARQASAVIAPEIGLDPTAYRTNPIRRTNASLICAGPRTRERCSFFSAVPSLKAPFGTWASRSRTLLRSPSKQRSSGTGEPVSAPAEGRLLAKSSHSPASEYFRNSGVGIRRSVWWVRISSPR